MKTRKFLSFILAVAAIATPSLSKAQSYPPVWSSTSAYVAGDIIQYGGNWYRAMKSLSPNAAKPATYGNWELNFVRSNTTLMIGVDQTFPNLQAAWEYCLNARIAPAAYLHLSISTTHGELLNNFQSSFSLDHPFGAQISIMGDNSSKIFLGGSTGFSSSGLTIDTGHVLASLSNVTILGSGGGTGLLASTNACISCSGVQIDFFGQGVNANRGAYVSLDYNSGVSLAQSYGMLSSLNATIYLTPGFSCTDTPSYSILYSSSGGNISAGGCFFDGNNSGTIGADAEDNGSIDLTGGGLSYCGVGAQAYDHSYVNASGVLLVKNTNDFTVIDSGVINITGIDNPKESIDSGTGSYIYT